MSQVIFNKIYELLSSQNAKFRVIEHAAVRTSQEAAQVRNTKPEQGAKALVCVVKGVKFDDLPPQTSQKQNDAIKFKNGQSIKPDDKVLACRQNLQELAQTDASNLVAAADSNSTAAACKISQNDPNGALVQTSQELVKTECPLAQTDDNRAPQNTDGASLGQIAPESLNLAHASEGNCTPIEQRSQNLAPTSAIKNSVLKSGRYYVLAVLPGHLKANLDIIAQELGGTRASLASPAETAELTDCVFGSVPPFSFHERLLLAVDPSLFELNDEIAFNAGLLERSIVLNAADYARITRPMPIKFASNE